LWLYFRFNLCFAQRAPDVEAVLAACGVVVTYETIRQWCKKFGRQDANQLRRRRAQPGNTWHLDEVFLTINGRRYYLWQAVNKMATYSIF
jgi:putative transposase